MTLKRKYVACLPVALLVALLAACGHDDDAGSQKVPPASDAAAKPEVPVTTPAQAEAGRFQLLLNPDPARATETVKASLRGTPRNPVFIWSVDDRVLPESTTSRIDPGPYRKGDTLTLTVQAEGHELSASVPIINTPPVVTDVQFASSQYVRGTDVVLEVDSEDADGDSLDLRYEWTVNNEVVFDVIDGRFPGERLRKDDRLRVRVTPFDGEAEGRVFHSDILTVLSAAPRFVTQPPAGMEGFTFVYAAQAVDPDDEPVTYHLLEGPPGMTMDGETGVLRWELPTESPGPSPVRIVARDAAGSEVEQSFTLNFSIPQPNAEQENR